MNNNDGQQICFDPDEWSNLVHRLKGHLTVIKGNAGLIGLRGQATSEQKQMVQRIEEKDDQIVKELQQIS